jgi:mannose-6-phosphate isomerase-like protein (cupin superfamily)
MTRSGTPIDRITLGDDVFAPRSALLHEGPGEHAELRDCEWWVYAAAARLPSRIVASKAMHPFRGETAQGRVITGMVRVAHRNDDAYGTELLLGSDSPGGEPVRAESEGSEPQFTPSNHEGRGMSDDRNRADIIQAAWTNEAFRREVLTGEHLQVVVMTIPPGGEIGDEVHPATDQLLLFVDGHGEARLDGEDSPIGPNELVFVRSGTRHNFINGGEAPLRLITVYAPPEHAPGTFHQTKADADAAEG